ncbi:MAG: glycine oxidase ThiO [Actinomycetota bacterium]|nr:glycine oxidase ThiO [Actinomycetota bacterium]
MPLLHPPSPDVVVIGGGVAGLGVAWRAALRGARVVVLERDELGSGTSRWAAGMLAPVSEAELGERALLALGLDSLARWPAFAAELEEIAGHGVGYRETGALVVARDRDEAEALDRELGFRRELGLAVERLRPSQARRLEPALAPTVRLALSAPDDHVVDPRLLVPALAEACRRAGVELRVGAEVERVLVEGDRAVGVAVGGEALRAGQVVAALGPWSGGLAGLREEARVAVRPVKGQIMRLRDPEGSGLVERVLRFAGGYLVPRGDGRYVLGATVEERGFDTSVTAGGLYELLRDAGELVPGVHELVVEEVGAGLRPGSPDNTPLLGPSAHVEGLVWATGHYRNGILLAPVTAELVAGALLGEPVPDAFAPDRFARVAA